MSGYGQEYIAASKKVQACPLKTVRFVAYDPVLLGFSFALPLAVLPGLEQPFSQPKLILLAIVIPAGLLGCRRRLLNTSWSSFPRALQSAK
jgi:hypothetical protein